MKIWGKKAIKYVVFVTLLAEGLFIPSWAESSDPPEVSAQSAVIIEMQSGMVLYDKNSKEKVYPASTTKIMTALLAIEEGNMNQKIRVSSDAVGIEGSSIYLEAGEKILLRDLVYGLMLRSGNDAAIAISEDLGGSIEQFVDRMNRRALEIGAVDTHFVNPSGLFNKDHFTTAYDMALIAREAMKNPEFKTIVGARSWVANRKVGKYSHFYNKNKVIYEYEGGTGIKIGYTKASGRTLVASSKRNGMELICVVMNAPNWFNDSYKLMDYVYEHFYIKRIAYGNRILKAMLVDEGDKDFVFIGPKNDILYPIEKDKDGEITVRYILPDRVTAPVNRWQEAGELQVFCDEEYIYNHPLYFLEDITRRRCHLSR